MTVAAAAEAEAEVVAVAAATEEKSAPYGGSAGTWGVRQLDPLSPEPILAVLAQILTLWPEYQDRNCSAQAESSIVNYYKRKAYTWAL